MLEVSVDIGFTEILLPGEDHEMRSIGDLRLAVRRRQELCPHGGISDDDEFPGLQSAARGREKQCFFNGGPILRADLAIRIELFCGVAPVELSEELFGTDVGHGT